MATSIAESQIQIIALDKFGADIGRSSATLWRWRRAGWLKTINIAGKQYVTAEALTEFRRRAESGEFARAAGPQSLESSTK